MIDLIIAAVIAFGALLSVTLLKDVQQRVARWLREHGLANSALMEAVVFLDKVGTTIRGRVKVTTRAQGTEVLALERTYSIDQIKDQNLRAELLQQEHAQQNVLSLFDTA